jgi:o-succinylbenzoate---CoA ligase
MICGNRIRSSAQLSARIVGLANGLCNLGVQKDDRVVLLAESSDYCVEALMATMAVGAVAVPLNWRWSDSEITNAVVNVRARSLIIDKQFLRFSKLCPTTIVLGEGQWASHPPQVYFAERLIQLHSVGRLNIVTSTDGACIICFTSGTTGSAKGVVLTHSSFHVQSLAKLLLVGYNQDDVYLHTAPLFHVGGLSSVLAVLSVGATQVFPPKSGPAQTLALITSFSVTAFIAVPTILQDLVVESKGASFPSVRKLLLGGGDISPTLFWQTRAVFPSASIVGAYGMTEACSSMTFLLLDRPPPTADGARVGFQGICIGQPPPGIEMDIKVRGFRTTPFNSVASSCMI